MMMACIGARRGNTNGLRPRNSSKKGVTWQIEDEDSWEGQVGSSLGRRGQVGLQSFGVCGTRPETFTKCALAWTRDGDQDER